MDELVECVKNKIRYDGRDRRRTNKGRPAMIDTGSPEKGIIADWMEAGLGFRNTTIMVNRHRVDEVRVPVGRNAVMNAFDRMDTLINKIQNCVKGMQKMLTGRLPDLDNVNNC